MFKVCAQVVRYEEWLENARSQAKMPLARQGGDLGETLWHFHAGDEARALCYGQAFGRF